MNALKQKYVERALQHQEADEIVQGLYWEKGKGCCVGCLAHANENAHEVLCGQTNIPEWLSRVADTLHEGLSKEESKKWPARFIAAVPEQIFTKGWSETEIDKKIKAPFLLMILQSALENFDHEKFPEVKSAIDGSIAVWESDDIGTAEWHARAVDAACAAARAAYAADAAADAAYAARAAADAAYAARAAADAADAAYAARAARAAARAAYAADTAADAADAADAARAGAYAAYAAADTARAPADATTYKKFSDRLIEIMEKAAQV